MSALAPRKFRLATAALLLASLTACEPGSKPDPATPTSSAAASAPMAGPTEPLATPAADPIPAGNQSTVTAPEPAEPLNEQPAGNPAESTPQSPATEPALGSMRLATRPAKLGVPVDLRYSFDTAPEANKPVTLHLAAVPHVTGTNLVVSIRPVEGVQVVKGVGELSAQKANANAAYRQQLVVTRAPSGPAELTVLVTMEMNEGSAFGFFSIPLVAGNTAQKLDSVKQR